MRPILATLLLLAMSPPTLAGPEEAARDLARRVIPQQADRFTFEQIKPEQGRDVFEVEGRDGRVVVRGNTAVAMASGLNWYLKHHCHCHLSWCGDQLNLPDPLPAVAKTRRRTPFQYRYFFNYCAFSYTMAWWDWPQWQRMIDWMALHGINMPLAVTGQEAVWQGLCRKLGLTDDEIGRFFVGPAYLPFGWMGCIDGWGGPLPQRWIDRHEELQRKILRRERELGMTPVLQGFTGHVPAALKRVFPQARFRQLPSWAGFPGTLFLDPLDPQFRKVGRAFVEEQTRRFGSDHLYAADTFIEMQPPTSDPAFLGEMSKAVYGGMRDADPEAVWVMQGWMFYFHRNFWRPPQTEALLTAVPGERMVALDLFCESNPVWNRTDAFYGKPWVFGIIQTFGDVVSLHGGLPQIAKNLAEAMTSPKAGKLCGVGHIVEGLGCNPVVHDLLTDVTWRTEVPQLGPWLEEFVHRRYGRRQPQAMEAWKLLSETVYSSPGPTGTVITHRPSLAIRDVAPPRPALTKAWRHLLAAADDLGGVDTYQFDLVNLSRQVLSETAGPIYQEAMAAYKVKDRPALRQAGRRLVELAGDLDELCATRRELLLGRWLADAKSWGDTPAEQRFYEWNARNQITLWGPRDSELHDYARKQWAGMFSGFYRPRWQRFFDALDAALDQGRALDAKQFERDIRQWEEAWTHGTESYPAVPHGDAVGVSRRLWEKYRLP